MASRAKETAFDIFKKSADGFLAGILISLGGAVFLACCADLPDYGKYVDAVFFSVALVCICIKGYALYTGRIGLLFEKHAKDDVSALLLSLLGNFLGTVAFGYLLAAAVPSMGDAASTLCEGKLLQEWWQTLVRALCCGILVYLAVDIYKNHRTLAGIVFCIPVFILSGYEHSIADMFYFAAYGVPSFEALLFVWLVILGNSLGGLLIPAVKRLTDRPARRREETNETPSSPSEET